MTPDPSYSDPPTRHASLHVLTASVGVLAVCAVGAVLTMLRSVVTPLLTGLLLLLLINPFVSMMNARHVPRWLSYLLLFVIGSATVVGVEQLIETQGNEFIAKVPEYKKRASSALDQYARTFGFANKDGRFDTSLFGLEGALPAKQDQLVSPMLRAGMEVLELCTMALFYLLFGLAESQ